MTKLTIQGKLFQQVEDSYVLSEDGFFPSDTPCALVLGGEVLLSYILVDESVSNIQPQVWHSLKGVFLKEWEDTEKYVDSFSSKFLPFILKRTLRSLDWRKQSSEIPSASEGTGTSQEVLGLSFRGTNGTDSVSKEITEVFSKFMAQEAPTLGYLEASEWSQRLVSFMNDIFYSVKSPAFLELV